MHSPLPSWVISLLLLTGCENVLNQPSHFVAQRTPAVQAENGGSAELDLFACPGANTNIAAAEENLHRLLVVLETEGLLVNGNGGSAKLSVDLCGP